MDKQLNGVELNQYKETVRGVIASQVAEAAKKGLLRKDGDSFRGLTLPGDRFIFESQLRGIGLAKGLMFEFDGAELSKSRFEEALRHKPEFCRLAMANFNLLMTTHVPKFDKAGVATELKPMDEIVSCDGCVPYSKDPYAFVWADYCGKPDKESLLALNTMVGFHEDQDKVMLLIYMTFSVGRGLTALRKLPGFVKSKSQKENIDAIFHQQFVKASGLPANKVRRILSIKYSGGHNYGSPMYTVGFAIGLGANTVAPIEMDMCRFSNDQAKNYHLVVRNRRQDSINNITDFRLSSKRESINPEPVVSKFKAASDADKDAIEHLAILLKPKYDSVKELNLAVFNKLSKKRPDMTLRNVSATITTRINHKATFSKAARRRVRNARNAQAA